jgi:hypothetical protein
VQLTTLVHLIWCSSHHWFINTNRTANVSTVAGVALLPLYCSYTLYHLSAHDLSAHC